MAINNALWIVGTAALGGFGVVALTQQSRIRSLEAAEAGANLRARDAAGQLMRRRAADSAAAAHRNRDLRAGLADRVHFGLNLWVIRPTDAELLDEKILILKAFPHTRIRIVGHCDERGGEIYNLALGRRRADAAREYLVQHGVDASRIETVSAGKGQPVDLRHDQDAWAKNRRDEFKIIDDGDSLRLRPSGSE
jgi:peptidoglycan-associated lipoprotein